MAEPERIKQRFFSLRLHPRNLFIPATLAIVLVLRVKFDLPLWGLAIFVLLLPLYYFVAPGLVKKGLKDLDRQVLRLMQQGKRADLLKLVRRQWFLRLLAPPEAMARTLGLVYSEVGDFPRACACYERAARAAGPSERLAVLMGLARARYRAGDLEGAEVVYRELVRRGQSMPDVLAGLAHSLLLQERDLGEALRLAKAAVKEAPSGAASAALHLTLAEALLARGKPGKARAAFEEAEVPEGDRWLEARRDWVEAQLAWSEGDDDLAAELFGSVADLDEGGGLGKLARRRLAELEEAEAAEAARDEDDEEPAEDEP